MSKTKDKPKTKPENQTIILSVESLDAQVAECVQLRLQRIALFAQIEAAKALIDQEHAEDVGSLNDRIADKEAAIYNFCVANRGPLFPDKKSRETNAAVIGFELNPFHVETSSRKITWKEVVKRLMRLDWGKAYIKQADPQPDKNALLRDREKLSDVQRLAAGIHFQQDEQFFIRGKSEVAGETIKKAEAA